MFYGELKEKGDITVTDASVDAFKEFLQFFHLNRVQPTVENVAEVMNLGHKYNVSKCVAACARFLKGAITNESACVCLGLAILYEQQELKDCCEKFIIDHLKAVFKSANFLECDKRVLALILKLNSLSCSETTVFEACMSWIKAKSNQTEVTKPLIQEHLGELFYEIRFTSMTIEEFGRLSMAHRYAFSLDEHQEIIHTIVLPEVSSKLFNGKSRRKMWNNDAVIKCDRKKANSFLRSWYASNNKPTTFETNQPLLLGTLVFAPIAIYRDGEYAEIESGFPFDVTIFEIESLDNADGEPIRTLSNFKINSPSKKETSITLPTPVPVRPGFYYEIRLNAYECTDNHRYLCNELIAEIQMENGLNIKFHGDRKTNDPYLVNFITGFEFNQI